MHIAVRIRAEQIHNDLCGLIHLLVSFILPYFFYNNDIFLIHCCDKIFGLSTENATDALQFIAVFVAVGLHDKHNTSDLCIDMQLFCTVININ